MLYWDGWFLLSTLTNLGKEMVMHGLKLSAQDLGKGPKVSMAAPKETVPSEVTEPKFLQNKPKAISEDGWITTEVKWPQVWVL